MRRELLCPVWLHGLQYEAAAERTIQTISCLTALPHGVLKVWMRQAGVSLPHPPPPAHTTVALQDFPALPHSMSFTSTLTYLRRSMQNWHI